MLGNTENGLVDGGFESELHQIFHNLKDGLDYYSLNLSNINAHEKIELAIKRMITNLTTKSARKKSFQREKSELPPKPTTCAAISCSI